MERSWVRARFWGVLLLWLRLLFFLVCNHNTWGVVLDFLGLILKIVFFYIIINMIAYRAHMWTVRYIWFWIIFEIINQKFFILVVKFETMLCYFTVSVNYIALYCGKLVFHKFDCNRQYMFWYHSRFIWCDKTEISLTLELAII